jgi:hypothetical protein
MTSKLVRWPYAALVGYGYHPAITLGWLSALWISVLILSCFNAQASPRSAMGDKETKDLVCYHQNQVLAALQAGVLLAAVLFKSNPPVLGQTPQEQELLRVVVRLLGFLYGKTSLVYSSEFVRRQIDESGLVPTINWLRQHLGFDSPLHHPTAP